MKNIFYISLLWLTGFAIEGCNKLVDVKTPENQLTTDKVFADSNSTKAALINIYAYFDKSVNPNYNKYLAVYTDDFSYLSTTADIVAFNQSNLASTNSVVKSFWSNSYFAIYSCNDMISQLQHNNNISQGLANTLIGEAKFLRAYAYFYLTNSFGRVPQLLTTNVNETVSTRQSDTAIVFNIIKADLVDAQNLLSQTYIGSGRARANKWAATALLARLYLYQQKWQDAEAMTTSVISSGLYTPLPVPSNAFSATSQETILQFNTQNGFIADATSLIPSTGLPGYAGTTNFLTSFETGDLRKSNWLKSTTVSGSTYYYPYKYHNRALNTTAPESLIALRASEQYLIRAEARIQQDNITGGITDLNIIRSRAGLTPLSMSLTKSAAIAALRQEWRSEFFAEWGTRYLDLKRTGRLNSVMTTIKTTWSAKAQVLPIPATEITVDPNLQQNAGY